MGARWCTVLLLAAIVAAARASDAEVKRSGVFIARNLLHKIDHKIVLEVSTDAIEKSGDSVTVTWSGVEVGAGVRPGLGARAAACRGRARIVSEFVRVWGVTINALA